MKSSIVQGHSHAVARHNMCLLPNAMETHFNDMVVSFSHKFQKWEEAFGGFTAAGFKFFTIISGDKKLAALLAGTLFSAAILITLLVTLVSRLI